MLEIELGHSHLYPGATGRVISGAPGTGDGAARLLFADGVVAGARLTGDLLAVERYTTAAGTAIPAKRWRLAFSGADVSVVARGN